MPGIELRTSVVGEHSTPAPPPLLDLIQQSIKLFLPSCFSALLEKLNTAFLSINQVLISFQILERIMENFFLMRQEAKKDRKYFFDLKFKLRIKEKSIFRNFF